MLGYRQTLGVPLTRCIIEFSSAVTGVPAAIQARAEGQLREICEALQAVPRASPFWSSLDQSRLCLVVDGWSFFYEVDGRSLLVTQVAK